MRTPTATPALKRIWRTHETLAYRDTTYGELDPGKQAAVTRNGVNVCPAAWNLQRCGAARNPASLLNLEHGVIAHRRIAAHATRVRTLDRVRRLMLMLIVALLAGAMFQILSAGGLPRP